MENPKWMLWTGRVLTALTVVPFVPSAVIKITRSPMVIEGMVQKGGFPDGSIVPIGVVELLCLVLYLVPRTAVLGAALLTAYLGGAVCTHARASEPFIFPIVLGVIVWAGIFLREPRLRALVPLRRS